MAIKFTGIGHVALRCKQYTQMERFYIEKLGMKKAFDLRDAEGNLLIGYVRMNSNQFIELFPETWDDGYTGDNFRSNRSYYNACFEVDARHEAYRDMDQKGVLCTRSETDTVGMSGSWCAFIEDPEGNQWELMEFSPISLPIKDDANNYRYPNPGQKEV